MEKRYPTEAELNVAKECVQEAMRQVLDLADVLTQHKPLEVITNMGGKDVGYCAWIRFARGNKLFECKTTAYPIKPQDYFGVQKPKTYPHIEGAVIRPPNPQNGAVWVDIFVWEQGGHRADRQDLYGGRWK